MKVELLKRLRKTHFIKYDMMSKQYEIRYTIDKRGKMAITVTTAEVEVAFDFYRKRMISSGELIANRGPRKKLIDVQHAVKPTL